MTEHDALDFCDIGSLLSEDERLVKQSVARFVDREVLPRIGRCFDEQRFPRELVPELAALGLLGAPLKGHGCAGVNGVSYGLICEELERGDGSLRSFVSVQTSLVMGCIAAYGSATQRKRWLPAMAKGEVIGCFGLTEPQGGSDPAAMRTRAVRAGGDWAISGTKHWITNGGIADVAVVWAATADGIRAFLVESELPGFARREIAGKFSLRASSTAELFLDEVRVSDDARLPEATSLRAALTCLDGARYGIAWGALGAARACLEEALEFARNRTLFGRPLTSTQLIQARFADAVRRLTTAQLLALRLGQLKDAGRLEGPQVSLAKWNNVRMALDVARECRDVLGAAGITVEHAAIRHMLNLESVVTYEGTESIHALIVGRSLTGHAAF